MLLKKLDGRIKNPRHFRLVFLFLVVFALLFGLFAWHSQLTNAQTKPLTFPEIITALNTKLPNRSFNNKTQLIKWLIAQIRQRKIDKPLTNDREEDLRKNSE